MKIPAQITFRHMSSAPALENRIRKEVEKLDQFHEHIMSCRVIVEKPHKHHHKGNLYRLRIDLKAAGKELVVTRENHGNNAHEDPYVVVRDAFDSMQRQLEDYARRQRGDVKFHEPVSHGRILYLAPMESYGKIVTDAGSELYFHRHSVLNDAYDKLSIGSEVRFVEESGEKGPQASTVIIVGKHHKNG